MTKIYWCPVLALQNSYHDSMEMFFLQPDPLFKALADQYRGAEFLECPAVQEFCKNTFVVRAPFDITYTYDKETNTLSTNKLGQRFFDSFCRSRTDGAIETAPAYLFYAKESVIMETLPVFLLDSDPAKETQYIPGQFDIGKWIRPVCWNFFMGQRLSVLKGDPLFFVRFKTANKIEFERVEHTGALAKISNACVGVKHYEKKIPLSKLYEMANTYIKHFLKGQK
jgi:hypothetical protein